MGVTSYNSSFLFVIPNDYNNKEIGNKLEDFELLQKLGAGGNGYAIKVKSKINHKVYVIKKSIRFREEDKRELIVLNKLDHPNICKCLSCFKENNEHYLVMDLYGNKDLFRYENAYSKLKTKIKEENIWNIFNQCLEALSYIHGKGYIHRDIKLSNIFMDEDGKIVIGDFGSCAMFDQKEFKKLPNNEKGFLEFIPMYCGTIDYMAPEVKQNKNEIINHYVQTVDVYSMGVCFYGLLYHHYPNINDNRRPKYEEVLNNDTYYDFELRKIIDYMLKQNPKERPSSSEVFKYFKKQYLKKYVAYTSVCSVIHCLFSFPNFAEFFFKNINMILQFETAYKKEIFPLLYSIKDNINNLDELLETAFVLKKAILKGENEIKDNVEISPDEVINSILNSLLIILMIDSAL